MKKTLVELRAQIRTCQNCTLRESCRTPVPLTIPLQDHIDTPGSYSSKKPFVVLGMAPGKVEDARGVPFVGPAGTLLRNEFRRTGIDPTVAYYMNAVCCMPPGNKVSSQHIHACGQNLRDQWDYADDAGYVLVCGNTAMESLLLHANKHTRGKFFPLHNKTLYMVHHPSHILRAKERGVYLAWQRELAKFKLGMLGMDAMVDECLYCERANFHSMPVCKRHLRQFNSDGKWRGQPYIQEKML
jgi:uracil-DNA glycosylase